ncbi:MULTISPECIES: hypothetical protein [Arthrospira]|jgi:hypothetical protein|uniref:Uncharacterized protein n=1 Tax=Limnospira platensis NIES-46 TaxID=1236695 RepID=A0A5M3TCW5_LIMPL|nr:MULTISPECIES: hypothetical protein [Arthrospira]AMW30299.1 hypothetical protein AP285_22590 [Arthrospira platensis YZ]KDR58290.1 hypothetical protein APPUASWS_005895 [Arthrospira platensis str. Paraca]MBD2669282.1 hypothetical protein [Arthrospira platensis FACHB-439]MBD2711601.1 hypothetical protein [Arthrospira platensis FACHB-835]MDT9296306.1 hypothetical protein [Arthrospira platensis PCC 7345]MDT9311880.1 hypothetical protein [Limnospira sp. Paracas R14]QQW28254.1 hypothetical protei
MLGSFQKSSLRIEVDASEATIRESLLYPHQVQQWLWPVQFSPGLPQQFNMGLKFTSSLGPVTIEHYVDVAESNCLRFLLSGGIDGFHEWYWGEGWVQSRLEGVSVLPLNLGQTVNLNQLRGFLLSKKPQSAD